MDDELTHADECKCHQCSGKRFRFTLADQWRVQITERITAAFHDQMPKALEIDAACACGDEHFAAAVQDALIDTIAETILGVAGGDLAVAMVLGGCVIRAMGLIVSDMNDAPDDDEIEAVDGAEQNAPSTTALN